MCTLVLFFATAVVLCLPYPLLVVMTTCGVLWPWPCRRR